MVRVHTHLAQLGLRARLVLMVHDELVLEVPREELGQVAVLVKRDLEAAAALAVPLEVGVEVGVNWAELREVLVPSEEDGREGETLPPGTEAAAAVAAVAAAPAPAEQAEAGQLGPAHNSAGMPPPTPPPVTPVPPAAQGTEANAITTASRRQRVFRPASGYPQKAQGAH